MQFLSLTEGGGMSIMVIVIYLVVIVGAMYFIAIRPQKKQQKEQQALLASLEVGDTVLTSSGFYGVLIDITEDTVIVEFEIIRRAGFRCRSLPLSRRKSPKNKYCKGTARRVSPAGISKNVFSKSAF